VKFTTVVTKVDFDLDDVRFALADYVDFYHHKPKLAENIRNNKFKVVESEKDKFSIKIIK
jgi:hypothetical protein